MKCIQLNIFSLHNIHFACHVFVSYRHTGSSNDDDTATTNGTKIELTDYLRWKENGVIGTLHRCHAPLVLIKDRRFAQEPNGHT